MSDEVIETEPSLARIIASAIDSKLDEPPSALREVAKYLLVAINTDPQWATVQASLRQMANESTVDAILARQRAAMAGIVNRLTPSGRPATLPPNRPSTREMQEAEADIRSHLPEIVGKFPEFETAAEKIIADPEKRRAIERISTIVNEANSKLSPFALCGGCLGWHLLKMWLR